MAQKKILSSLKKLDGLITGCGEQTLHTLLGDDAVNRIFAATPRWGWWNDRLMVAFLRKNGFKVKEITKLGVTSVSNAYSAWSLLQEERYIIKPDHVVLANLLMCRGEASWFLILGNKAIHNREVFDIGPLFFLNKPPQSVYLLGNKKWL